MNASTDYTHIGHTQFHPFYIPLQIVYSIPILGFVVTQVLRGIKPVQCNICEYDFNGKVRSYCLRFTWVQPWFLTGQSNTLPPPPPPPPPLFQLFLSVCMYICLYVYYI